MDDCTETRATRSDLKIIDLYYCNRSAVPRKKRERGRVESISFSTSPAFSPFFKRPSKAFARQEKCIFPRRIVRSSATRATTCHRKEEDVSSLKLRRTNGRRTRLSRKKNSQGWSRPFDVARNVLRCSSHVSSFRSRVRARNWSCRCRLRATTRSRPCKIWVDDRRAAWRRPDTKRKC